MKLLLIALKSLLNRKFPSLLTVLSIALSTALLVGIQRLQSSTKESFESTVSGVDLIVGARSGPVNLLLYSVFRIGNATNNIPLQDFKKLEASDYTKWAIPISLGDSHRGYKVVGTNSNYFKFYQYGGDLSLSFKHGRPFANYKEVVLGHEVAKKLSYKLKDQIVLSHGTAEVSFESHDHLKFKIVGILNPTGTPVDRSVHISLHAVEALHMDESELSAEINPREADISAFFLKLKSKMAIFESQRFINEYADYPLLAIIPSLTLRDLWGTIGVAEKALNYVSYLVLLVSLLGLIISLISSLNERSREIAILRSIGANPAQISFLMVFESFLLTVSGLCIGFAVVNFSLLVFKPILESQMGLSLGLFTFTGTEASYIVLIFVCGPVAALIPAYQAYRRSLSDGLKNFT